ncbi:MAG TPA: IS200/IS605 family transposase [Draconibacterium sp.]|nr:IS200/IS605 family transposase [Draconibacterium sp.]
MTPGTFTQIYLHFVFAVKFREALLQPKQQKEVFPFIAGLIDSMGHKSYAVNGMPDHVHVFMSFSPSKSPSETIKEIKRASSNFINDKKWFSGKFQWQNGYGCFSYGKSQINAVVNYILNQKEHHHKTTFREEYLSFLTKFEVPFDERYLFEFFD